MINVPWIFNALWMFVKTMLDARYLLDLFLIVLTSNSFMAFKYFFLKYFGKDIFVWFRFYEDFVGGYADRECPGLFRGQTA